VEEQRRCRAVAAESGDVRKALGKQGFLSFDVNLAAEQLPNAMLPKGNVGAERCRLRST
jgi:hypothetical protein